MEMPCPRGGLAFPVVHSPWIQTLLMKSPVRLTCTLPGTIQSLPDFFAQLHAWAQAMQVPADLVTRMTLMLDEWLTNVAMHAYAGQGGPVCVEVEFLLPRTLRAVVRDQGPAFDPTALAVPDVQAALAEREIGGLGVHLVRRLAKHFTYRRDGVCNEVTMSHTLTQ